MNNLCHAYCTCTLCYLHVGKHYEIVFEYVNAALDESWDWRETTCQVLAYSLLHSRPPHRTRALSADGGWRMEWNQWWTEGVQ